MSQDRISLQFDSFRGFLEECSDRISEQGIFLATDEIKPVGSRVEFHLGIDSDFPLMRGTGEVVWVVESDGAGAAPGMAVRYESTDEATATLARKIAERQRARTGSAFDLDRAQAGERAPSLATLAVDALIGDESEPDAEAAPEPAPEAAPEPVPEAAPEPAPEAATEPDTEAAAEPDTEAAAEPAPAVESESPAPAPAPALDAFEEATVEMEPRATARRTGLWATVAVIAALAGAAYWQRDLLREKLGEASDERAAAPAAEPAPVEAIEPAIQAPVEPAIQTPADPAADPTVEPEVEAPAPQESPSDPPPTPAGPLTRIEEVRWRSEEGATLLELAADGAFAPDGYALERLEDPPRVLVKIPGVTAPLSSPTLAVGSEEVVGVRTGLHGSPPATSLHVVVDLADPTAQVTSAEAVGPLLRLRIASSAISP